MLFFSFPSDMPIALGIPRWSPILGHMLLKMTISWFYMVMVKVRQFEITQKRNKY